MLKGDGNYGETSKELDDLVKNATGVAYTGQCDPSLLDRRS